MWAKPSLVQNLETLRRRGVLVVEPESGHLASGHTGSGRLAGAGAILEGLARAVSARYDLAGRRVVVSAGGTREPIDPVRYISNYSSGKMGFALAAAAAERGAQVVLVSSAQHPDHQGIILRPVETAAEMLEELRQAVAGADLLVMAAAVADFKPARREAQKIRREERAGLSLELEAIPDLLLELAREPRAEGVFRVGFAAESADLEEKNRAKLERKALDASVVNDISRGDIAFGSDFNAGVMLFRDGERVELERMPKRQMADRILDLVRPRLK
jgi:phosphopantothenoylcysteine decarboxylase/phosphopantothenate--cysteine ligase